MRALSGLARGRVASAAASAVASATGGAVAVETRCVLVNERVPNRGGCLEVDVYGSLADPPVVLLHGGGQTRHSWARTAVRLAQLRFCAVTVDLRGHGGSFWDPEQDYSYEAFAHDLVMLTQSDLLRDKRPAVVGASLGGLTLMCAGSRIPNLSAAVLVDILPKMQARGVDRILTFMYETSRTGFATVEEALHSIETYTPHRKRQRNYESVQKNLRQGADGRFYWHWDPAFLINRYDAQSDGAAAELKSSQERLDRLMVLVQGIQAPILLIRGQKTDLITAEDSRAFVAQLADAEFVDVQGASHMIAGDTNDVFTAALVEFLLRKLTPGVAPASKL